MKKLKAVVLLIGRKVLLLMAGLGTRGVTAVAVCAALWAVLNALVSPVFWQFTQMPFLCDLLAFAALILVVWWTRRFGAASVTGVVFGVLSLILRPGAFFNVAFVVAAIAFDFLTRAVGYDRMFSKPLVGSIVAVLISVVCAALAGLIIGALFMNFTILPAILAFAGLHAIGGVIGGVIGAGIVMNLKARRIDAANVRD
jgi:hypothetical protein